MKSNFPVAVGRVLRHEGGFVNHPRDPAGATNKGITFAALTRLLGRVATLADIKNVSDIQAITIYQSQYWDRVKGNELPSGLDYAVFDFAVNSGPDRAIKMLQRMVGAEPDGSIGPKTLAAVEDYVSRETAEKAIKEYQAQRLHYLQALPHFDAFGKGWTRRVADVLDDAVIMAKGDGER